MAHRPLRLPAAAPVPRIALLRRRQQIVVRAAVVTGPTVLRPPRPSSKTMMGLGPEERFREAADTLPAPNRLDETPPPVSCVRVKSSAIEPTTLAEVTPRPRPVTLIDGVHDRQSHEYLEEAKRLLASGIFSTDDTSSED